MIHHYITIRLLQSRIGSKHTSEINAPHPHPPQQFSSSYRFDHRWLYLGLTIYVKQYCVSVRIVHILSTNFLYKSRNTWVAFAILLHHTQVFSFENISGDLVHALTYSILMSTIVGVLSEKGILMGII